MTTASGGAPGATTGSAGGAPRRLLAVDVEHLVVDVVRVGAALAPAAPGRPSTMPERAAEVPLVDRLDRHQHVGDPLEPLAVEPAAEQLDVLRLAGEHVDQLEPVGVARS